MLNTQLILIEGLPGAGKTTTATYLGNLLQDRGLACRWFLEGDKHHPIACLDYELRDLCQKMPPLWQAFTDQALSDQTLTLIESRLWQNTALFMWMSEYSTADILHYHRLVWQVLTPLSPCLVVLEQENVAEALRRICTFRGADWTNRAIHMTSSYPWFQSRGLHDFEGWVWFFEEWQSVSGLLYQDWPFRKIRVVNAHENWDRAYQQIHEFLQIESGIDLSFHEISAA